MMEIQIFLHNHDRSQHHVVSARQLDSIFNLETMSYEVVRSCRQTAQSGLFVLCSSGMASWRVFQLDRLHRMSDRLCPLVDMKPESISDDEMFDAQYEYDALFIRATATFSRFSYSKITSPDFGSMTAPPFPFI